MQTSATTHRSGHQIGQEFILAGKAIFTLVGKGLRFTYRVSRKDPEPGSRYTQPTYFVGLLNGPNNDSDYAYLGILDPVTGYVRLTKNSRMTPSSQAVQAIQWALPKIWARVVMPPSFGIFHEGRCGRCGRTLTVPESVVTGFGPECAGKLGIDMSLVTMADGTKRDMRYVDGGAAAVVADLADRLFDGPAFQ